MEDLKRLQRALWFYRLSLIFPIFKLDLGTGHGFCIYFAWDIPKILENLAPETLYKHSSYWFKPGEIRPRIKLLKQAIKNLKNQQLCSKFQNRI